jgi:hypothetical protein
MGLDFIEDEELRALGIGADIIPPAFVADFDAFVIDLEAHQMQCGARLLVYIPACKGACGHSCSNRQDSSTGAVRWLSTGDTYGDQHWMDHMHGLCAGFLDVYS